MRARVVMLMLMLCSACAARQKRYALRMPHRQPHTHTSGFSCKRCSNTHTQTPARTHARESPICARACASTQKFRSLPCHLRDHMVHISRPTEHFLRGICKVRGLSYYYCGCVIIISTICSVCARCVAPSVARCTGWPGVCVSVCVCILSR